ncbi:hypothetical protein [Streptomyces sp. NRRL WC-3742]|uniref:hypothetical protein n=1 Tax=Streptomyces sp. NRRL WC-3742 TaxID=1463934 RepID=UPI0004CBAD40|nr:hypothetical protein [Streptomyces sp. NRRL WC-3742]
MELSPRHSALIATAAAALAAAAVTGVSVARSEPAGAGTGITVEAHMALGSTPAETPALVVPDHMSL